MLIFSVLAHVLPQLNAKSFPTQPSAAVRTFIFLNFIDPQGLITVF